MQPMQGDPDAVNVLHRPEDDDYDMRRFDDYASIFGPIDDALQTSTYAFDPGIDLFDQKNYNNSVHLPFWFAARLAQYIQEMEELRNGDT